MTNDHPHRVALVKKQLIRHVQTPHPHGKVLEDEVNLRRWTAEELKAVHAFLHLGNPPRLGDE